MSFLAVVVLSQLGSTVPLGVALERNLQAIPIHGEQFRSTVKRVAGQYPQLFGEPMSFFKFQHPVGGRDSTLISLGVDKVANWSFIVFREGAHTRVETVNTASEIELGSSLPKFAAWSGSRFCEFLRFHGGTGNTDEARMFEIRRGSWQLSKRIQAFGENVWEGDRSRLSIVTSNPVDIRNTLVVRRPPPGFEDRLSHSDVWLDYRQELQFKDGWLRQLSLRKIDTPAAVVYDLLRLRRQDLRQEFNRRVAVRLQDRLWSVLSSLSQEPVHSNGQDALRDETPELIVGSVIPLTLTQVHGKWTVTRTGKTAGKILNRW